jgi:hypothetical protein
MRFKAISLAGEASTSRWRACAHINTFDNWDYPKRDAYMRPSISVVAGKSAERNTFMLICSTDDIGDGTKWVVSCH